VERGRGRDQTRVRWQLALAHLFPGLSGSSRKVDQRIIGGGRNGRVGQTGLLSGGAREDVSWPREQVRHLSSGGEPVTGPEERVRSRSVTEGLVYTPADNLQGRHRHGMKEGNVPRGGVKARQKRETSVIEGLRWNLITKRVKVKI